MKNHNFAITSENILIILCFLTPFVEIINSITLFQRGGDSAIGKVYRILYLAVLFYLLWVYGITVKSIKTLLQAALFMSVSASLCYLINGDNLVNKLYDMTKYMLPILTLTVLSQLYSKRVIEENYTDRILSIYSWLIPITYFIPLFFGIGYYQYDYNRGYKGLNYMINDINIIVGVCSIFAMYMLLKDNNWKNILKFILSISCLIYMQTKASVTITVAILLFFLVSILRGKQKIFKVFIAVVMIGGILFVINSLFTVQISNYFARLKHSYISMQSSGYSFMDFFTTTRTTRLDSAASLLDFNTGSGVTNFLFGLPTNKFINSEMDFFDIMFKYGIFSSCFMFIYYGRFAVHAFRNWNRKKCRENLSFFVMIAIMLLFSTFGGHVLMSAYSGSVLALVCFKIYCQEKEMQIGETRNEDIINCDNSV